MIKKIVYFIRRLFGQEQDLSYGNNRGSSRSNKKIDNKSNQLINNSRNKKPAEQKKVVEVKKEQIQKPIQNQSVNKKQVKNVIRTEVRTESSLQKPVYHAPRAPSPMINKAVLMRKIKTNIFFLEQLLQMLEGQPSYKSYYRKVREMKEQSESCFKLVHRMKEDASYFNNTLKTVLQHTDTVAELLDMK